MKSPVRLERAKETTQVCFVIDRSQSMHSLRDKVVEVFNKQAEDHRTQAKKYNQETRFSLITFSDYVDDPVFFDEPVSSLGNLTRSSYQPNGMTALYAATHDAISRLQKTRADAYLLIVITDGGENNSDRSGISAAMTSRLIKTVNATDRWTISFMVPPNANISALTAMGLYSGNIQKWDATEKGMDEADVILRGSTQSYYQQRAVGQTFSKSFFSPDVRNLSAKAVKRELFEVTKQFKSFNISSVAEIKPFIEQRGLYYSKGCGFYQLTKKETVQAHKSFIIRSKKDHKLYMGNDGARALLGLPIGGSIELYPAAHVEYDIFVQSTSVNRKLIPGTTVLYQSF